MKNLSHLSDGEINDLIEKYYDGRKIDDLLNEFNINLSRGNNLVRLFPPIMLQEIQCVHCKTNMYRKRHARSSQAYYEKPYCIDCGCCYINAKELINCYCKKCNESKRIYDENVKKQKRASIDYLAKVSKEKSKPQIDDIDIISGAYLLSIIRVMANENMDILISLNNCIEPITPTFDFSISIIKHLLEQGLIIIHETSPLDSFVFDENFEIKQYCVSKCFYALNFGDTKHSTIDNYMLLEKRVKNLAHIVTGNPSTQGFKSVFELSNSKAFNLLLHNIAFNECAEYLLHKTKEHGFDYKIGPRNTIIINKLLQNFSVAQVYNIIYRSVKEAIAYQARTRISRAEAMNIIPGKCLSYAETSLHNGWNIMGYGRDFACPRSIISMVVYDQILQYGDVGFTEIYYKFCSIDGAIAEGPLIS